MDIGNIIKQLRTKNNLTQQELGKILGVEKSTISMYENNKSRPDDDIKSKIADYFNVTTDYLLGRSNNPKLTKEDENDVFKRFEELKDSLENTDNLMFCGEILDEETRELLLTSLQQTILTSKIISKEREKNKK